MSTTTILSGYAIPLTRFNETNVIKAAKEHGFNLDLELNEQTLNEWQLIRDSENNLGLVCLTNYSYDELYCFDKVKLKFDEDDEWYTNKLVYYFLTLCRYEDIFNITALDLIEYFTIVYYNCTDMPPVFEKQIKNKTKKERFKEFCKKVANSEISLDKLDTKILNNIDESFWNII
jgi:hypothetical protein